MSQVTCKELIKKGRHIPVPFEIFLRDAGADTTLHIQAILRIVPRKRLVALATWKGTTCIAKLFFGRAHWQQNRQRDLTGVTQLRDAGILTPEVVGVFDTPEGDGGVILFEYLEKARSLLDLFTAATIDAERRDIVDKAIASIAQCHDAGLQQDDIHLDNFMLEGDRLYVLDGYDIKQHPTALSPAARRVNLGLFFAQLAVAMDVNIPHWLSHYGCHSTGMEGESLATLTTVVRSARQRRLFIIENKLFRSATATRLVQSRTRLAVYDRTRHSPALERLIADPDQALAGGTMLKDGGASTVALIDHEGRQYVLKRYNIKGFLHGLKRLFQPSRAHKSWRSAATLLALGVATPQPCLFVEERLCWLLRRRAWFLCEYVPAPSVLQLLEEGRLDGDLQCKILAQFNQLFQVMREYNISHGDMKASNFIYHDERLYVIDLDATKRHRSAAAARSSLQKDIERFRRNWIGTPLEQPVQAMLEQHDA